MESGHVSVVGEKRKGFEDDREDSKRQRTSYSPAEIRALQAEVAALKQDLTKLDNQIQSRRAALGQGTAKTERDIDDELKDMFSSGSEEEVTNGSLSLQSARATRRPTTPPKKEVEIVEVSGGIKSRRSTSAKGHRKWQPVLSAPAWEKKRTALIPRPQDPFVLARKVLLVGTAWILANSNQELQKHHYSFPFLMPVDPIALGIPNYPLVIKHPMDLNTVSQTLKKGILGMSTNLTTTGSYVDIENFISDVRLIWSNAMTFNLPEHDVYKMAQTLSTFFENRIGPIIEADRMLNKNNKQRLESLANSLESEKQRLQQELEDLKIKQEEDEKDLSPALRPREEFIHLDSDLDTDAKNKLCDDVEELDPRYSPGLLRLIKEEMADAKPESEGDGVEFDLDSFPPTLIHRIKAYIEDCQTLN